MTDREAFEAWWYSAPAEPKQAAWEAWQAALAQRTEPQQQDAMERYCHIELPGVRAALSQQAEPVAIGDYVLATKFFDGDPGDNWGVGFYDGERNDRHYVKDGNGQQIRANGFRRVGKISHEMGRWLLENARTLENSPPGLLNLWNIAALPAVQQASTAATEAALWSRDIHEQ